MQKTFFEVVHSEALSEERQLPEAIVQILAPLELLEEALQHAQESLRGFLWTDLLKQTTFRASAEA